MRFFTAEHMLKMNGKGEDSSPLAIDINLNNDFLIAVFDGMGGAGATICNDGYTEAYHASHAMQKLFKDLFEKEIPNDDKMKQDIQSSMSQLSEAKTPYKSQLKGTMKKRFPTTACLAYSNKDTISIQWAGDSRVYALYESGVFPMTVDHVKLEAGSSCYWPAISHPQTKILSLDNATMDKQTLTEKPLLMFCCTDGFFDDVNPLIVCQRVVTLVMTHITKRNGDCWQDFFNTQNWHDDTTLAGIYLAEPERILEVVKKLEDKYKSQVDICNDLTEQEKELKSNKKELSDIEENLKAKVNEDDDIRQRKQKKQEEIDNVNTEINETRSMVINLENEIKETIRDIQKNDLNIAEVFQSFLTNDDEEDYQKGLRLFNYLIDQHRKKTELIEEEKKSSEVSKQLLSQYKESDSCNASLQDIQSNIDTYQKHLQSLAIEIQKENQRYLQSSPIEIQSSFDKENTMKQPLPPSDHSFNQSLKNHIESLSALQKSFEDNLQKKDNLESNKTDLIKKQEQIKKELEETHKKQQNITARLENMKQERSDQKEEFRELNFWESIKEMTLQIIEKLQVLFKKLRGKRTEHSKKREESTKLNQKLSELHDHKKDLENRLSNIRSEIQVIEGSIIKKTSSQKTLEEKIEKLNKDIEQNVDNYLEEVKKIQEKHVSI